MLFTYSWGSIRDGVLLFQHLFLTGVLLTFSQGGVVIKSGAQIKAIRYVKSTQNLYFQLCYCPNAKAGTTSWMEQIAMVSFYHT